MMWEEKLRAIAKKRAIVLETGSEPADRRSTLSDKYGRVSLPNKSVNSSEANVAKVSSSDKVNSILFRVTTVLMRVKYKISTKYLQAVLESISDTRPSSYNET